MQACWPPVLSPALLFRAQISTAPAPCVQWVGGEGQQGGPGQEQRGEGCPVDWLALAALRPASSSPGPLFTPRPEAAGSADAARLAPELRQRSAPPAPGPPAAAVAAARPAAPGLGLDAYVAPRSPRTLQVPYLEAATRIC